jgi:hypothetical protein
VELIFKRPAGKLPFVGIAFAFSEWGQAQTLNEQIIYDHPRGDFSAHIRTARTSAIMSINIRNSHHSWRYEKLKFNRAELIEFLKNADLESQYNFGHVMRDRDKDSIARANLNGKPFFIQIALLEVIFEYPPRDFGVPMEVIRGR